MQINETTSTSHLSRTDAGALFDAHRVDLMTSIPGFIRTMGLPDQTASNRDASSRFGRPATKRDVRFALLDDIGLQDRIYDQVELKYWRAFERGAVRRHDVGGLLNRIAQRTTWRLATARARELLLKLQPTSDTADVLQHVADPGPSAEELLGNGETLRRAGQIIAALPIAERQLVDAKLNGLYAELAAANGKSVGAVKTAAHRLWKRVCAEVLGPNFATDTGE